MTAGEGPSNFFYFNGRNSGLKLPTIGQWPKKNGFSLSTWIYIESYRHPNVTQKAIYRPQLLSFLNGKQHSGIEIYFDEVDDKNLLTIQIVYKYEFHRVCNLKVMPNI